uniref:VanW family protein n=1 Tax=Agathobacter sp. TaxID=2021311 RepID=UPI004055A8F5
MKKVKHLLIVLSMVLAGTFLLTGENVFKAEKTDEVFIEEGVYIGGVSVGGMNTDEAAAAVEAYLETLKEKTLTLQGPNGSMELSFEDMGYSANTQAAVQEAAAVGNSGSLISRFKALQDLEAESYVVDMGLSIDKQATAQAIYNKADTLNIKAIDHGLKRENGQFVYVEGQIGDEVDIVTSVNALNAFVGENWENPQETPDTVFALTSVQTEPRGTKEELATVKDLLGSFSTSFSSSGADRAKNVTNGCAKIDGTLLYPGDVLSVYELVHPFTKENGYELAGSYLNGETVESFGGGICQVSTTLYNAALKAELEIVERFNHSMTVAYVDLAADAAIAGTYKDLKFKNNYSTPIYVEGYCNGRTLVFNIYGEETRAANRKVSYVSETVSTNNPNTEYTLSSSAALGTYNVTRSKHTGYVAKLWKVVKVDGVETERTQVNKSTYKASAKKVTIGTAGATAEQLAAINEALATKNDSHIQSVVKGLTLIVPQQPDSETSAPGGTTTPDSGTTTPDAGSTTPDSGATTPDAGSTTPDSGTTTPDAGGTTPDSGTTTPDAGGTTPDSGTTTPDAGSTTPDSGAATNAGTGA